MECPSGSFRRSWLAVVAAACFVCLPAFSLVPPGFVYDRGSMQDLLDDRSAAEINLSELKNAEHLYALGALSKGRGEILVFDSQPYEARCKGGRVQVYSGWSESAAYLVWSSVPRWRKTRVPPSVRSMETLEMWLASMSGKRGSPLPAGYPFLIKGHFGRVSWHVDDRSADNVVAVKNKKKQVSEFHGVSYDLHPEVVGFYSPADQGVFIPRGHRTHMHLKVGSELVAHVDDFDPCGDVGLILYVPCR